MSESTKGRWYNDPENDSAASVAPATYASGASTLSAFTIANAKELLATLNTHDFLRTSLTGSNNDLDIIALQSGSGGTGIHIVLADPSANNAALSVTPSAATLATSLTGSNNDLDFTAVGNNFGATVAYVDPSANSQPLQVEVNGDAITVHLATDSGGTITSTAAQVAAAIKADNLAANIVTSVNHSGNDGTGVVTAMSATAVAASSTITVNLATNGSGTITSTAAQVAAAINADPHASNLVTVALAPTNDGTGVVTALSSTALGVWPGTSPTLDVKFQTSADGSTYNDSGTAFVQKTAPAAAESRVFGDLGLQGRWVATVGGTSTPVAAFSLAVKKKIEA